MTRVDQPTGSSNSEVALVVKWKRIKTIAKKEATAKLKMQKKVKAVEVSKKVSVKVVEREKEITEHE